MGIKEGIKGGFQRVHDKGQGRSREDPGKIHEI